MKTEIIGLQGRQSQRGKGPKERTTAKRNGANPAQVYSKIVERYATLFDRPEARLRFLNNTLAKQAEREEQLHQSLRRFRFLENTKIYNWALEARFYTAILEELRSLAPAVNADAVHLLQSVQVPLSARIFYGVYQARHALYAMAVLIAGLLVFGLYSAATWSARRVNTILAQKYQRNRPPIFVASPPAQAPGTALAAPPAKYLAGYKPEKVWQVESNREFERYSNGIQIWTKYETENHPRGWFEIPRGSDTEGEKLRRDVVGIVYHTSESDIVPFTSDNNLSIKQRSQGLLEYVQRNKSYNYVIDRYGGIYRIVRDDHAAHHSGHSIWADDKFDYVGLNESFIGICFESTSAANSLEETLTEAQFNAGRGLTNVLRSKHEIDDANCTTHGLVSVNPDNMLIAYHHDWVRNFPFDLMGLSDKYKVPPPNMIDYGFTYDEEILTKLGRVLWPGAITAEDEYRRRAEKARANPELLRRKLRDRYIAQLDKARKLRTPQDEAGKSAISAQSSITSSSAERGDR